MLKRIGITAGICVLTVTLVSGCTPKKTKMSDAYWQRIETHSALYLTGPKAQQQLEQSISRCVREIDELVELEALRETTPPDTHSSYHGALEESGDLDYFETPARYKDLMVDHSDFHDFESCMRYKGWERVLYVRYQQAEGANNNYKTTTSIRKYGTTGTNEAETTKEKPDDFENLNK